MSRRTRARARVCVIFGTTYKCVGLYSTREGVISKSREARGLVDRQGVDVASGDYGSCKREEEGAMRG
jgi:hypothetical protein